MDASTKMAPQDSLFQVYLRLRPAIQLQAPKQTEPWLIVEPPFNPVLASDVKTVPSHSTHITLQPPNDSRKRAIERFGFTKIFQEEASQLNVFDETGTAESIKHVLQDGRDGLVATLGVTGSGKVGYTTTFASATNHHIQSHTILGSKSQRGLTQMTLDVLFHSIGSNIQRPYHPDLPTNNALLSALQSSDPSEAQIMSATTFLESVYGDGDRARLSRAQTPMSRAQTPMMVWPSKTELPGAFPESPPAGLAQLHDRPPTLPRESAPSFVSDHSGLPRSVESLLPTIPERTSHKEIWRPPAKTPFWHRLSPKKPPAKPKVLQETLASHHSRRPPLPRPSTLAQSPDVSSYAVDIDHDCDYAILVSMYEVYNDRIFDLLSSLSSSNGPQMSTRQGAALQKGLLRRPLLFKNTEMSQDRKVVAGLRKIVCGSYDEAMMVLETGLTERRVAGTGSNSVSSRSHGFFCIEVKKNLSSRHHGLRNPDHWTGGTISIVDLAGSERARNAKTTGSTLAEAGKINESLMYLGQCLQVQSDCQQEGSKPIVPFRQCKLTELLFSNSFPSSNHSNAAYRAPQKAVMIVTADPQGDFNATSQILRYSALAREVTVPRVPSLTSTILAGANNLKLGSALHSGRTTPLDMPLNYFSAQELEQAHNEVNRLSEECDVLAVRLTQEEIKRTEAELKLQASEEKALVVEQEIREECWSEMEARIEEEKQRWRMAWEEERLHGEEYMDGKLEILEKTSTFTIHEDKQLGSQMEELERENETLKAKLRAFEQETQTRSPTKKTRGAPKTPAKGLGLVLQETSNSNIATNPFLASLRAREVDCTSKSRNEQEINTPDVSPRKLSLRNSSVTTNTLENDHPDHAATPATTKKKQRKLTTRKWDLGDPDEIGL